MGNKEVDLWSIESQIYPILDAKMMRKEFSFKDEFDLGGNQKFSIAVNSKNGSPVSLHQQFNSNDIDFKMDFRSDKDNWFRTDNQSHDYLHFHLESGGQLFDDRIKMSETNTISGLISETFEKASNIISWKFPSFLVVSGTGFVGTA
ncbi:MAG: hypothetical protein PF542_01875 [Nanoarchaeota archaeon]|jgi:hypothetical protein|nr:hypothetical protein [Nanoarchaeota archaeon]